MVCVCIMKCCLLFESYSAVMLLAVHYGTAIEKLR